jgi:hypothetical protein
LAQPFQVALTALFTSANTLHAGDRATDHADRAPGFVAAYADAGAVTVTALAFFVRPASGNCEVAAAMIGGAIKDQQFAPAAAHLDAARRCAEGAKVALTSSANNPK